MKKIFHTSKSRGFADHGWLQAYHTFSFANYYNPARVQFGTLRVLNDDAIHPAIGFDTHPHNNMEIITIVLSGEVRHRDSMGHEEVIHAHEVQVMSAGTGIYHSEYNNSKDLMLKLLQIWVFPREQNVTPRYAQQIFDASEKQNRFRLIVSPEKDKDHLWINQDAYFSLGIFDHNQIVEYQLKSNKNGVYIFVIEGQTLSADEGLEKRDGMEIWECDKISMQIFENAYILVIEVPMQ